MMTFTVLLILAASVSVLHAKPQSKYLVEKDEPNSERFMHFEDENGELEIIDLDEQNITYKATIKDVTYYLYTRANRNNPHVITNGEVSQLQGSPFNPLRQSMFVTHGWLNSNKSGVNTRITAAALENYDINVFVVDWRKPAKSNYITAKNAVTTVGKYQGQFINNIQNTYHLPGDAFVLVGHSLGAHVAGNAGAVIRNKVKHIVGLDPALPLFSVSNTGDRLDPTDAKFVQIIHTNGGKLGFQTSIGHADYYPNGGKSQPGCGIDATGTCSHLRAYMYFAESLSPKNKYSAVLCGSYKDFTNHKCSSNKKSLMGQFQVDHVQGDYFLDTNSKKPYARG